MESHELQEIKDTIKSAVESGIEINVNGKIRTLSKIVDDYIKEDIEHNKKTEELAQKANEERIRIEQEHKDWRIQVDKTLAAQDTKLQLVNNIQGFGRVFMYVVGVIVIVGSAILTYTKLLGKE